MGPSRTPRPCVWEVLVLLRRSKFMGSRVQIDLLSTFGSVLKASLGKPGLGVGHDTLVELFCLRGD